MERLKQRDLQSLDPSMNVNGGPLVDVMCDFQDGTANVLDRPQVQELYSDESASNRSG